jgi:hypothetical protein
MRNYTIFYKIHITFFAKKILQKYSHNIYSVETFVTRIFIKKILFFLAHILAHNGFCLSAPEVCNHPYFFFFQISIMVCQATPRVKSHFARNRTHYLFPEYFQSQFYVNFVLWYLLVFLFLVKYIKCLFKIQKQILSF